VVAASWAASLTRLGWDVVTVAGDGPVDRLVPGLRWPPVSDPAEAEVREAIADVDLVVVENVCSLPLHAAATAAVAAALRGRPAVLHHHDLPWQRDRFAHVEGWPPDDPAWRHVTVNDLSRAQLADRGIDAVTIRPVVDVDAPPGDPAAVGLFDPTERVLLHPVRAIERKDVPAAVRLAEALGATYWLTGPAEEGYDVGAALAGARCRVVHERAPGRIADGYAAADAVAFPSTWEGFGVPVVESALHRRPLAIRRYPVADELAAFGFTWFPHDDPAPLATFLADPDEALLDRNEAIAREHFSPARLDADLTALLRSPSP
jgi:glycosyltransferase involved in cell wall biosynthesis